MRKEPLLTTAIVMPLVTDAGRLPIRFGIYPVIVVEGPTAQNVVGVATATTPFGGIRRLTAVLLALLPSLALFLPHTQLSGG